MKQRQSTSKQSRSQEEQEKWKSIRKRIQKKFSKLPKEEVAQLEGHLERLPEKVAQAYGYDKKRAIGECEEFIGTPLQSKKAS